VRADYRDLIGKPYGVMDCWSLTRAYLMRCPGGPILPVEPRDHVPGFVAVEDEPRPGDLVEYHNDGGSKGVGVIVEDRMVLTSTPDAGTHKRRLREASVAARWRWIGEEIVSE
jgi:cell wall-associated NlpC family hydrolase